MSKLNEHIKYLTICNYVIELIIESFFGQREIIFNIKYHKICCVFTHMATYKTFLFI